MKAISISYLQSVFDVLYCRCDTPVWAIVVIIISLILLLVISIFAIFNCKKLIKECNSAKKLASIDPLTGLLNRQAINKIFEDKLTVQHRGCAGFSIIFIDINGLKKINDNFGHVAGDRVLKTFAHSLTLAFCSTGNIGRWAGDEFIILVNDAISDCDLDLLCKKLYTSTFKIININNTNIRISASFGYARYNVDASSIKKLIMIADERMYKNKKYCHMYEKLC
ncbi:GGDEF domain-containing protein [Desulfovibrio desulfuricans]|uniref:GGDEF domain-containing protein n=1 Tax=Desulfovibrio desulfuricans TaxID=876 RepID=UPI001AEAD74D|nr:GGDEF domain-containing protein [Desulfovibrio desulfuricans]QTO41370.1 GGDEF domain-containing protein [Desulfovibrio desulfuricans]